MLLLHKIKIDKDLSDLNFNKTLIPLEELNNLYPNNKDILLRLSITHHYLSEKEFNKKKIRKIQKHLNTLIKRLVLTQRIQMY